MKYSFQCPNCQEELILGEDVIGMKIRCTECEHEFKVTRSGKRSKARKKPGRPSQKTRSSEPLPKQPHASETRRTASGEAIEPTVASLGDGAGTPPPADAPAPAAEPMSAKVGQATPAPGAFKTSIAEVSRGLRRVGVWLTPPILFSAGVAATVISVVLPFYASASARLPGPNSWEPWSTGVLENRLLVLVQGIGVAFAAFAVLQYKSRALRLLAVSGVACAFWATWLLAAGRARELTGPDLRFGGEWLGVGLGAGLFLAGAAIAVAAGVRTTTASLERPWRRAIWGTSLWLAILVGIGLAATELWGVAGLERLAVDASITAARDVCGLEVPGSVAVRLQVTNQGPEPVLIVARRGGQYASDGDRRPIYWLRVRVRSGDDPRWRRLQQPAWSGPWPKLDFRSARDLDTGEAWQLETPIYRKDVRLIRGGRPDEVMVELTDVKRRWFVRRIITVTSRTHEE